MKKLSMLLTPNLSAGSESKTHAVLAGTLYQKKRLEHLIYGVIPKMTLSRPTWAYEGELERILLDPLYELAVSHLKGTMDRGKVEITFQGLASRYALAVEFTNLAGIKPILDSMAGELIEHSQLTEYLKSIREDFFIEQSQADKPASITSQVLTLLTTKKATGKTTPLIDEELNIRKDILTKEAIVDNFSKTFTSLMRSGGQGKGIPLPAATHRTYIMKLNTIEHALSAMLNPSLIASASSSTKDLIPYLEDGYALAMAYVIYLHHSSSDENYDSIFPPAARMPLTINKVAHVQSTARRAAWFFAGLSSASSISDLTLVLHLFNSIIEFFKDGIIQGNSVHRDLLLELSIATNTLALNSVAPVDYHSKAVIDKIRQLSEADELLPAFIDSFISISMPKLRTDPAIVPGSSALLNSLHTRRLIPPSAINTIMANLFEWVRSVRVHADLIAHNMNSFLSVTSDYDPNSLNVPNEIFAIDEAVIASGDVVYTKYNTKEFLPLSINRYLRDKDGAKKWVLQKYQFGTVDIIPLKFSLLRKTGRFVWDVKGSVKLGSTLAARWAWAPIPACYLDDIEFSNAGDSFSDLVSLLSGVSEAGLGHPATFFLDAAMMIHQSENPWRARYIAALAGVCRVFVNPKSSSSLGDHVMPNIDAIYGMPTLAFMGKQPAPSDDFYKNTDRKATFEMEGGATVSFLLHKFYPVPDQLVRIPSLLDDGVWIDIPINAKALSLLQAAILKEPTEWDITSQSYSNTSKKVDYLSILASLRHSNIVGLFNHKDFWLETKGWSNKIHFYPHIFFNYERSFVDWNLTTDEFRNFIHLKVTTSTIPATRQVMVHARTSETIVLIEPADIIEVMNSEDLDPTPTYTKVNTSDPGTLPDGHTPPTPHHSPNVETSETTSPAQGDLATGASPGPSSDEYARRIRDNTTAFTADNPEDKSGARSKITSTNDTQGNIMDGKSTLSPEELAKRKKSGPQTLGGDPSEV